MVWEVSILLPAAKGGTMDGESGGLGLISGGVPCNFYMKSVLLDATAELFGMLVFAIRAQSIMYLYLVSAKQHSS